MQLKSQKVMDYFKYKAMFNMHGFVSMIKDNPNVDFIAPHPGQQALLDAYELRCPPTEESIALGLDFEYQYKVLTVAVGRRGGKSFICSAIAAQEFLIPHAKIMVSSYELPNARHIFETVHAHLKGMGVKFSREAVQEMYLVGENGSTLQVSSNENVLSKLGGAISLLLIDEAKLFGPELYEKILRPMLLDYSPFSRTILISSPEPNNWLERYYRRGQSDDEKWSRYWSISFSTWMNPTIPREELKEMERTMPPDLYAVEVMGLFTSSDGLVFKEFNEKENVYTDEEFSEMEYWKHNEIIFQTIDSGYSHYFASLWVMHVEDIDTYFVLPGEYMQNKTVTPVHCENIHQFEEDNALDVYIRYADPAAAQQCADMQEYGLYYNKSKKATRESINATNTLFFQRSEATGRPKLLVHKENRELIRQLVTCQWKKGKDDQQTKEMANTGVKPFAPDKEQKTDFDLLDALRYGIYSYGINNRAGVSVFETLGKENEDYDEDDVARMNAGWVKM